MALARERIHPRGRGDPDAEHRRWIPHIAAGGVWTTAADFAAMVFELQRALRGEPDLVLSQASAELMVEPHDAPQYGLGVFQRSGGEQARYVSHLGDGPGFVAGFNMDVVGGRGMVILTNGQGGISLVREIARSVATVGNWPDFLPEARVPITLDAPLVEAIAVRYQKGFDDEVVIQDRDGALWLESLELQAVKLVAVGEGTLVCRERKGELIFERGPEEGIVRVSYHLADELGRSGGNPTPLRRLALGERTPIGLLLDGEIEEATSRFQELFEADPDSPAVAENRLNSLGYRLLGQRRNEDALAVFDLNVSLYPESANVYDSMGEALTKTGRFDEAVASYRRSLELDPGNSNAAEKIAKLTGVS